MVLSMDSLLSPDSDYIDCDNYDVTILEALLDSWDLEGISNG